MSLRREVNVKLVQVLAFLFVVGCSPPDESKDPVVSTDSGSDSGSQQEDAGVQPDLPPPADDGWGEVTADEASQLQAQLELGVQNHMLPGAAMGAVKVQGSELWAGATGSAGDVDWAVDRQFRIGSVSKTFTTAVLLQLVGEGVVSLDDTLEQWVPGYYDGLGVTVQHLATNTSGIVSYNYVGSFDDTVPWTPTGLVDWAVLHEPDLRFEPGSQWEYSNTNFILIGLVIEAATEQPYEDAIQVRLLDPLGLEDTYVAFTGDINPRVVSCYDQQGADITDVADPSFGWAAGSIVSTPRDLVRWAAELYAGDVLSPEMLSLMTTPFIETVEGTFYGMGAFIESDGAQTLIGHTGGIGGYQTSMHFLEPEQYAVVVMSNKLDTDLRDFSGYGWSVLLGFSHP